MTDKNDVPAGTVEGDDVSKLAGLLQGGTLVDDERNSDEPDPGSDDDAPPEKAASGEEKAKREPAEPAIEPPTSWDAEAKETFRTLPRNVQEFLNSREAEREKGVNLKLQEAAEVRKKAEAEAERANQYRTAYEQRLIAHAKHLEASIPDEFKAIKSPADLYEVSKKDPALAARYTAFQQQAASVLNELSQVQYQRQAEAQARHAEYLGKEAEALAKVWPDFVDQTKGPAIRSDLSNYAKERGFSDAEVNGLADHRLVMVLKDAVEGRKAIAALEKAKGKADKATPAKVARPGQGEKSAPNGLDNASLKTALRSGNTDKQVNAMARILQGL
jgi:hypothetical protein